MERALRGWTSLPPESLCHVPFTKATREKISLHVANDLRLM